MILISVLITILLFFIIYIIQHSYTLHYHGFHSLIAINQSTYLSTFLSKEVFFISFRYSLFQFLIHLFYENNIYEFFPSTFPFLSDLSWSLRSEQRSSSSTGVQPEREIWCDISYTQQTPLVRTYFNTF